MKTIAPKTLTSDQRQKIINAIEVFNKKKEDALREFTETVKDINATVLRDAKRIAKESDDMKIEELEKSLQSID